MPKTNDRTNKALETNSFKTSYSRSEVISLLSQLCGLTNLQIIAPNISAIIKPSLLISASVKEADPSNRFSFFCSNPTDSKVFYHSDDLAKWQSKLPTLEDINKTKSASGIPFHSGWLGYCAYPNSNTPPSTTGKKPIAEFHYYPWVICVDHFENTFNLLGKPSAMAEYLFSKLKAHTLLKHSASASDAVEFDNSETNNLTFFKAQGFQPLWNKQDYQKAFNSVQDYLIAGDCYQINLTQAYKSPFKGNPASLLATLFKQMQPNFGGYFKGANVELISLSPERFISIDAKGRLEAKPIKGTIKRSSDALTDKELINELSNSSKNKAENLMIVDLLRNDLSKSALPGSVKVEALFELESHPNVHHLVSTISAQLKTSITPATAISQAFPGGSITGAPKIRAMEIIEELEAEPRSLYCGSLGYFSDSGHSDFNILIRNLEFRDGVVTCWGGGGITVDSEVNDEYEESITKIRRIMDLVENMEKASP